jgi:hypothetical protein
MTRDMSIAPNGSPQAAAKERARRLGAAIDRLAAAQVAVDEAVESYGYAVRECRKRGLAVPGASPGWSEQGVQWCGSYECGGPHRINDLLVCPGGTL